MEDSNSILLQECINGLHRHASQLQNVSLCSVAFSWDNSGFKLTNLFKFDAVTESGVGQGSNKRKTTKFKVYACT